MTRLRWVGLAVLLIFALQVTGVQAQDQGAAVITSPLEGAIVSGLVSISGTATHPQFHHYELAFGYDPNPTDTWFSIQEPSTTQVVNDLLGRWSTSDLTDGVYVLRLRVYWSERGFLEAFVHNIRIQNATPTPTMGQPAATHTPTSIPILNSTAPPAATVTQPLIVLPPTSTPRPATGAGSSTDSGGVTDNSARLNAALIQKAFFDGVKFSLISFALLGIYVGVRAALRSRSRR